MLRALDSSPGLKDITTLQDEVIATLLLHDLIKNGKGLDVHGRPYDRGVTGTHGVTLADKMYQHPDIYLYNDDTFYRILAEVAMHMGIWTTKAYNEIEGYEVFANLIHLADYCASRKVDVKYEKLQGEQNAIIEESTTQETVSKSPPCPGVRQTENRQTTTAENGQ